MKFKYLSFLAVSALLAFSACKKKDEGNDEPSEVTRESVTEGNYDPDETSVERYLRIMRSLNSSQSAASDANSQTSTGLKALQEIDYNICSALEAQNSSSQSGASSCFKETIDCADNGNLITYTFDYGTTGCDAGDEILVGKLIYKFIDMYKIDYDSYDPDATTSPVTKAEFEFVNFGEVSSPKYNALGYQKSYSSYETGASITETEATYEFISANEILDIELEAVTSTTLLDFTRAETTSTQKLNITSDQDYTIVSETTEELYYSSTCTKNNETITTLIPLSGREKITMTTEDGETVVIYSDYGDGECDETFTIEDEDGNIVTINSDYEIVD